MRIAFVAVALFVSSALAQLNISSPFYVAGVLKPASGAVTVSYIQQGFETTGAPCYDNSEIWTESGNTINTNTSFASEGSRALALRKDSGADPYSTSPTITPALGNSYWYFTFATTITNAQHKIVDCLSNGTLRASIWIRATGRMSLYEETDLFFGSSPTEGVPTNTLVHVWANFNLTAGTYELAWDTIATKPSSGSKYATASGTPLGFKINQIQPSALATGVTNYFDKVRGTNIVIGSNPP